MPATRHIYRAGAVGLATVALLAGAFWWWSAQQAVGGSAPHMEVRAAHAKAKSGELILVDIRRPNEWRRTGIPQSGHAISMHQSADTFLAGILKATGGDRSKPVGLICATGGRSTWVQPTLRKWGFKNLINVSEGMMGGRKGPGWLKKGLPTRKWSPGATAPQLATVK